MEAVSMFVMGVSAFRETRIFSVVFSIRVTYSHSLINVHMALS